MGPTPSCSFVNISAFILYLQVMQLVRDCTYSIAVGHSWLAKLLTLVVCLKMCIKKIKIEAAEWSGGGRQSHTICTLVRQGSQDHRVHRVEIAAFWRTFSHEGKISPGW